VAEYAALTPTLRPIFVLPPSYEVWQKRLLSRYGGDQAAHAADIQRRLRIAREELLHVRTTDYFSLVVNDDLRQTVQKVDELAHSPTNMPERDPDALRLVDNLLACLEAELAQA
jgi:guanylate kinase